MVIFLYVQKRIHLVTSKTLFIKRAFRSTQIQKELYDSGLLVMFTRELSQ